MDDEGQTQLSEYLAIRKVYELKPQEMAEPIVLDLPRWTATSDVRFILQYFSDIAAANSLHNTPAASKLVDALRTLDNGDTKHDDILLCDELVFQSSIKFLQPSLPDSAPEAGQQLTRLQHTCDELVHASMFSVPVFNIWDSISLIYTLCVEPITDHLHAELHLFQFRSIVQILSNHWHTRHYTPSTVAAAWSKPDPSRSVTIAFATTCSGPLQSKRKMQRARYEFARYLIHGLKVVTETADSVLVRYNPGNCSDWPAIIMVCRVPGQYYSLCQNKTTDRIYKMCGYCLELQSALASMGIDLLDLWDCSNLGEGEVVEIQATVGYSFRKLMDYSTISQTYSHLAGVSR